MLQLPGGVAVLVTAPIRKSLAVLRDHLVLTAILLAWRWHRW